MKAADKRLCPLPTFLAPVITSSSVLYGGQAVSGYVGVATRVLASPQAGRDADPGDVDNYALEARSAHTELAGQDGTLLGVIPVPGTGTSLVIVGCVVATPDTPPAPGQGGATGLLIDRMRRRAWADGREIVLTFQEFELLAFLSEHPGTVFSRAELGTRAWQGTWRPDSRTVDVHVSRLRRKLGPAYGRCIATEYRAGYRFQAPGTVTTDPGVPARAQAARPGRAVTTGAAGPEEVPGLPAGCAASRDHEACRPLSPNSHCTLHTARHHASVPLPPAATAPPAAVEPPSARVV